MNAVRKATAVAASVLMSLALALAPAAAQAGTQTPSRAARAPRGGETWSYVHLFLDAAIYNGYGCDNFGSDNACSGNLGGGTTTSPWDGGTGTARWLAPGDGKLYVGFFKYGDYLSGWMPGGGSDRFVVTSGHMAFAGDNNVVSGDDPNKRPSPAIPGNPADQGAPLWIGVRSHTNFLGVHIGYYFDVRGWVRNASEAVHPVRPRPVGPPQFTGGTFKPSVGSGFDADSIAQEFIDLAKDPVKNFVLDQLGFGTPSELDVLKARIDALDAHLTKIGEQLNAAIAGLNFDEAIRAANTKIEALEATFDQYIKALINDVIDVKKAQAAGDKTAEATAMAKYDTDKKAFVNLDGASTFGSRAKALHLLFQPGSGATGLIAAFGDKLLANQRYLTREDSLRQDAVYNQYEEYQALASWLTCEWDLARDHPELCQEVVTKFIKDTTDQRDPKLAGSLPPDLPAGVVLDRGPYDAKHITSLNKPLLTSAATSTGSVRRAFWQRTPISLRTRSPTSCKRPTPPSSGDSRTGTCQARTRSYR